MPEGDDPDGHCVVCCVAVLGKARTCCMYSMASRFALLFTLYERSITFRGGNCEQQQQACEAQTYMTSMREFGGFGEKLGFFGLASCSCHQNSGITKRQSIVDGSMK